MAATRPTGVTQERVFKWWDYPLFVLLSLSGLLAIFSFLVHWFSFKDWLEHPASFSVMTVILIVILTNNQGRWFLCPLCGGPNPWPLDRAGKWPWLRPLCRAQSRLRCCKKLSEL